MLGAVLRVIVIITGIYFFCYMVMAIARRKMTETMGLVWAIISICLILSGILLDPHYLTDSISIPGLWIILILGFGVLFWGWHLSVSVSILEKKNQELAMQISLLNQEHDRIQKTLQELTGKTSNELWRK